MQTEPNRSDLEIDRGDLAGEMAKQASLYDYYAEEAANAKAEADRADASTTALVARTELAIRKDAETSGMKLTEGRIKAMVDCDPQVTAARMDVIEKTKAWAILRAMVSALDHKKTMLDGLNRARISKAYAVSGGMDDNGPDYGDDPIGDSLNEIMDNKEN